MSTGHQTDVGTKTLWDVAFEGWDNRDAMVQALIDGGLGFDEADGSGDRLDHAAQWAGISRMEALAKLRKEATERGWLMFSYETQEWLHDHVGDGNAARRDTEQDQAALEEAVRASGGLLYGRKRMKLEPASSLDMKGIAATLRAHQPVMVRLEPGDATRYDLLITPCSANEVRYGMWAIGVPPEKAAQYIHVCQPRRGSAFVRMHPRLAPWDLEDLDQNEWSRKVLAWWLGRLSELVLAD